MQSNHFDNTNDSTNSDNHSDRSVEQTIIELQTHISYLEDSVDSLNDVIAKQDKQLQDMQRQLQLMFNYLHSQADGGVAAFDLLADKPPHY